MICDRAEVLTYLGLDQPPGDPEEAKRLRSHLALANLIHPRVESLVRRHLGYRVESGHHVEHLPPATSPAPPDPLVEGALDLGGWGGGGAGSQTWPYQPTLQLTHLPVRAITSVHENENAWLAGPAGSWPPETLLTYGADYVLDVGEDGLCRSGLLLRPGGSWPTTPRSVRVEYDAGWTPAELDGDASDIKLAVLVGVVRCFHEARAHRVADDFLGAGPVQSEGFGGVTVSYARVAENLGLQFALPAESLRLLEPHVRHQLY